MENEIKVGISASDNFSKAFDKLINYGEKAENLFAKEKGGMEIDFDTTSLKNVASTYKRMISEISNAFGDLVADMESGMQSASMKFENILSRIASSIPVIGGLLGSLVSAAVITDEEISQAQEYHFNKKFKEIQNHAIRQN